MQKKTDRAFGEMILLSMAVLAAIIFASVKVYQISALYIEILVHKIKDSCGCENMTQFFAMHPNIFLAVIFFGAGIGIFIIYAIYKIFKLNSATKKYISRRLSSVQKEHSPKLAEIIKLLGMDAGLFIETSVCGPEVFCFGYLKPKICISKNLVEILNAKELKAVLLHEIQHVRSYDPLKIFIVKYFNGVFFFLPGAKKLSCKYAVYSELSADEKASKDSEMRSGLAGAILKISKEKESMKSQKDAMLHFNGSIIEERANRLCDKAYIPRFNFLDRSLIAGSLSLAVISSVVIFAFSGSTKAFEMHGIANCASSVDVFGESGQMCSSYNEREFSSFKGGVFQEANDVRMSQNEACESH